MSAPGPWRSHARQWASVGPPLRPSGEDLAVARTALADWGDATGRDDPTIALLGVTPELSTIPRGERSRLIALDRSMEMIRAVWPGRLRPRDRAVCADWRRLPLDAGSVDFVFSDGCLSTLPYPAGYAEVAGELRRVLGDGGRCVLRCFVQREEGEPLADVLADLADGRVGGFHAFKWRLVMALQPDAESGVALAGVWETLHAAEPDAEALCRRCGWSIEAVRTIDAYRGVDARYSFPALGALRGVLEDAGFSIYALAHPTYELGDRCPSFVLGPRDGRRRA